MYLSKFFSFLKTILDGDLEMQKQVTLVEMPKYKTKMDRFGKEFAVSSCQVNNDDYDLGNVIYFLRFSHVN